MSDRVDFFVVGAQKAGTTALAHFLQRHPDLEMSKVKETHFFDDEAVDWDSPDYGPLHAHFDWSVPERVRGEATPIYTYWPPALARVRRYNPAAKLVVVLRQPALRAYSHWRMEVSRDLESSSFEDAVSETGRRRVNGAPMGVHRVFSYIERGYYAAQVERALSLFTPEQVHFLRTEDLWSDPTTTFRRLADFLGVRRTADPPDSGEYVVSVHAAHVGTMSRDAQAHLTRHYAGDIRRTAELTGLDLEHWLDEDYREPMSPASA